MDASKLESEREILGQLSAAATVACRESLGLWFSQECVGRASESPGSLVRLREKALRALKLSLILPIILTEWMLIFAFFVYVVWFEVWMIFQWGGCKEVNGDKPPSEWMCMSADQERGFLGWAFGATPSILEGIGFELLMQLSKVTADWFTSLWDFDTRERRDFARVMVVFLLEVVGKVGFVCTLGLGFVPYWDGKLEAACRDNLDYAVFGEWSLGCLKATIPRPVRIKLFESCMKGPMLVSGFVSIGIKTLLPLLLAAWRRCRTQPELGTEGRSSCRCQRTRAGRLLLAPWDFVLRTCTMIFQADFGAAGGLRLLCRWPPTVAESCAEEEPRVRRRLWLVLLEGQRRKHDPFDEYIEVLLHFLWTSCFSIVWPLGAVFSLVNQLLELRFDAVKMFHVRRRRFPAALHTSLVWVPFCSQIICHVSIVVNIVLLLLPYQQYQLWVEHRHEVDGEPFLANGTWQKVLAAFGVSWLMFAGARVCGVAAARCWLGTDADCKKAAAQEDQETVAV